MKIATKLKYVDVMLSYKYVILQCNISPSCKKLSTDVSMCINVYDKSRFDCKSGSEVQEKQQGVVSAPTPTPGGGGLKFVAEKVFF